MSVQATGVRHHLIMRARAFVILWVGAAIAATTIAWQGVSIVDSQVISPAPAISTARSSAAAIPIEPAATASPIAATPTATPTAEPGISLDLDLSGLADESSDLADEPADAQTAASATPAPTAAVTRPDPAETREPNPRPTARPERTAQPAPTATAPAQPTATPPPPATATPQPTATSQPTATPQATQVLTFDLVGGTASVSFAPNDVHVLWATPEPGFSADIGNGGPGLRVEFRGDDGESRIDIWWDEGPQWRIDEDHD